MNSTIELWALAIFTGIWWAGNEYLYRQQFKERPPTWITAFSGMVLATIIVMALN